MRSVSFEEMFPWEVSRAIQEAPVAYLPLGVLEWRGEHAAVGLVAITGRLEERARRLLGELDEPTLAPCVNRCR